MKSVKNLARYQITWNASILLILIIISSCEKDDLCKTCPDPSNTQETNLPPIAEAGEDLVINLPNNRVLLDGSTSYDSDGQINVWYWNKIAGPDSFYMSSPNAAHTPVGNLVEGVYVFELKVTDNLGLFTTDTISVTVNADPTPDIDWQMALGGSRIDIGQSIQTTADGGYILVGNTNSSDGNISGYHEGTFGCYETCFSQIVCDYFPDGLIVKLNSSGAIEWQKAVGGSGADNLLSVQPTADGGYIASGLTYSNDGDVSGYHGGNEADAWVVKFNSIGTIEWQKVLGGSTGCDFANAVLPTPEGGYIIVGHTDSHDGDLISTQGERDVWVVKLNNTGTIEWQSLLGGSANDYAYSLLATTDGGYVAAGYSYSNDGDVSGNHGDSDAWVVKFNNSGTIQWQKSLGGSKEDIARSIQLTKDGGYIVAGSTKSNDGDVSGFHSLSNDADAWIVKLNSGGDIQWQKTMGGSNEDIARSIQPTPDGGYIFTGSAISNNGDVYGNHGIQDVWIVKLDSTGSIQWQKSMGGNNVDFANAIQVSTDGSYIVAGQTSSYNDDVTGHHGSTDVWVVKLKQ